jgi:hypothetical protein
MPIALYDLAGLVGAVIIMAAYFANQQRWLPSDDWRFPGANLVGASLILVSLWFDWNLPSFVIELAWALVSILGVVRAAAEARAR